MLLQTPRYDSQHLCDIYNHWYSSTTFGLYGHQTHTWCKAYIDAGKYSSDKYNFKKQVGTVKGENLRNGDLIKDLNIFHVCDFSPCCHCTYFCFETVLYYLFFSYLSIKIFFSVFTFHCQQPSSSSLSCISWSLVLGQRLAYLLACE